MTKGDRQTMYNPIEFDSANPEEIIVVKKSSNRSVTISFFYIICFY